MARRRWTMINGELVEVSLDYIAEPRAPMPYVIPDLPDFRSPIDGKVYSGRTGLREHCIKHDVVPTADLKGLPPKLMNNEYKPDREAIRGQIIQEMRKRKLF